MGNTMKHAIHESHLSRDASRIELPKSLQIPGVSDPEDINVLRQQLAREISCLEGQLFRLKTRNDMLELSTLQTYEDMLVSRKKLLETI